MNGIPWWEILVVAIVIPNAVLVAYLFAYGPNWPWRK